jgi:hypothetical protein
MDKEIKIIIADDHPIFREGLKNIISEDSAEVLRENLILPLPPNETEEYNKVKQGIHSLLGEEAFSKALAEGRALTIEQAIELALQEVTVE